MSAWAARAAGWLGREWERRSFAVTAMADVRSYRSFRRLDTGRSRATGAVRVRLRNLGGAALLLRPQTSDALMLREAFRDDVHLPPAGGAAPEWIVDFGANIGVTAADNLHRHPGVRVLAVELDPENAELCRRNLAPWGDRVEVVQAAVWTEDGEVDFERERGNEYGFRVVEGTAGHRTRALSIPTLLKRLPDEARVGWMKMDVEGVEAKLLSGPAAAWTQRVDAIGLQVHDPYGKEDCVRDLTALGFDARVDPRRPDFVRGKRVAA